MIKERLQDLGQNIWFESYSDTIRLHPQNYMVMKRGRQDPRWVVDPDGALDPKLLAGIIYFMQSHKAWRDTGAHLAQRLNAFDEGQIVERLKP